MCGVEQQVAICEGTRRGEIVWVARNRYCWELFKETRGSLNREHWQVTLQRYLLQEWCTILWLNSVIYQIEADYCMSSQWCLVFCESHYISLDNIFFWGGKRRLTSRDARFKYMHLKIRGYAYKSYRYVGVYIQKEPLPMAARSKAWVLAARFLGLRVRIPPRAWMSVVFCVLSGRGPYDGLITRPEDFYRVWRIWVWSWSLDNEETLAHWGVLSQSKEMYTRAPGRKHDLRMETCSLYVLTVLVEKSLLMCLRSLSGKYPSILNISRAAEQISCFFPKSSVKVSVSIVRGIPRHSSNSRTVSRRF